MKKVNHTILHEEEKKHRGLKSVSARTREFMLTPKSGFKKHKQLPSIKS